MLRRSLPDAPKAMMPHIKSKTHPDFVRKFLFQWILRNPSFSEYTISVSENGWNIEGDASPDITQFPNPDGTFTLIADIPPKWVLNFYKDSSGDGCLIEFQRLSGCVIRSSLLWKHINSLKLV